MKISFIFYIEIILFFYIVSQVNITNSKKLELNGIYRIDSLLNNYSLTDEDYRLQFSDKSKQINSQQFRIIQTEDNSFYIEIKVRKKIGVNQIGHVLVVYDSTDETLKKTIKWNIIKIDKNEYVIQNDGNKKFLEINNNFIQCINDLTLPIEENKAKISNNFKFNFIKLYEEVQITPEQEILIENEPIDVVIKYIDLTDKTLNRTGIKQIQKDEDNEELRYSVRSILQYIPWVRKIFILMPNEKVKYFKPYEEIKEKIVYVKDKDLLGYESANIYAFTFNLFRLEKFGISNNFIYMDDDFFIGKKLNKSNFFYFDDNSKKVVPSLHNEDFEELKRTITLIKYNRLFKTKDKLSPQCFMAWILSLYSTEKFFLDYYNNMTLVNPTPTHNAIAYNIQDLKEIYELVKNNYQYANEFLNSIERSILTLQTQHFVDLYALNIKKRKVHTIKCFVIPMNLLKLGYMNLALFAINTGGDRNYTQKEYNNQKKLMQMRFPKPTPYEIIDDNTSLVNDNIDKKIRTNDTKIITNDITTNKINNEQNQINELNSTVISNNNQKNEEKKSININCSNFHNTNNNEMEYNTLIQINKRQSLIIKLSNVLIIFMGILIILSFYMYCREKNKNKYMKIGDFNENRKKIEMEE